MSSTLPRIEQNGILLDYDNTVRVLTISGTVDLHKNDDLIQNYLAQVHSAMIESSYSNLTLDITQLKFLNSTAIAQIIDWILSVEMSKKEDQYHITIKYSSQYLWQESSVSTFVSLNDSIVSKERC